MGVPWNPFGLAEGAQNYTGTTEDIGKKMRKEVFKPPTGKKDLQKQIEGVFKRWDMTKLDWV